ncbi:MAG: helix-turn-helix transcriptional regulator [Lachnospiraceae bacterium]|nr:helix-turn-helix transcriptional regulator [Lachnospiraceae bacterium]
MDIGKKIRNARTEAKLTQEQAAEALGVSRQTISNWENEKSYPDIVSVVKMSDLYSVSLDHLLKGEDTMSKYVDYLEESTDVVKSRKKLSKLILMVTYLGIWAVSLIVFWFFTEESDAMGYAIMCFWVLLPVATFVISILIGKSDDWGREKWWMSIFFGVMYMFAEYATFNAANMAAFHQINAPEYTMILSGAVISLIGLVIGVGMNRFSKKKTKTA